MNSPLKLLSQAWRSPTDLARAIYEMMTSREKVVRDGPVEVRVRRGETGIRIVQRQAEPADLPSLSRRQGAAFPGSPASVGRSDVQARARDVAARLRPSFAAEPPPLAGMQHDAPAFSVEGPTLFSGAPAQFTQPPEVLDQRTGRYRQLDFLPDFDGPPTPSGGGMYGKVEGPGSTSGDNAVWSVTLYPNGPGSTTDQQKTVDVQILNVDPAEDAPVGLWIVGILQYSAQDATSSDTYVATVPTWLDTGSSP